MSKEKTVVELSSSTVTFNADVLSSYIYRQVAECAKEQFQHTLTEAIKAEVDKQVAKIGASIIEEEIRKVLAEGWPTTNSYGEVTGARRSLKDRIGDFLKSSSGYGNKTVVDKIVDEGVQNVLNREMRAEIEAARKSFKDQVDGVLTNILKKAVADHIGIKV